MAIAVTTKTKDNLQKVFDHVVVSGNSATPSWLSSRGISVDEASLMITAGILVRCPLSGSYMKSGAGSATIDSAFIVSSSALPIGG